MLRLTLVTVILIGVFALVFAPANADGGGSSFDSKDARLNPIAGDRVAVYCNTNNLVVWGIDNINNGVRLTTFTKDELLATTPVMHTTPEGVVTLYLDSPAQVKWSYTYDAYDKNDKATWIVTKGAKYHVVWTGGNYGADGSKPFTKFFSCTYLQ